MPRGEFWASYRDEQVEPGKPVTARGQATRRRLLKAAEDEFGEKGFHVASVSSITTRCGVGQGTFYIYFRAKEDILRELVWQMGREVRMALTQAIHGTHDRLHAERLGLKAFVEYVAEKPNLYKVVLESQFVDPAVYRKYYDDFCQAYIDALSQGIAAGDLREGDNEVRAWALMGMGHFIGLRYGVWGQSGLTDAQLDEIVDLIGYGMSAKGR